MCVSTWLIFKYKFLKLFLTILIQGATSLDMGRFSTGFGIGVFSYVVSLLPHDYDCALSVQFPMRVSLWDQWG